MTTQRDLVAEQLNTVQDARRVILEERVQQRPDSPKSRYAHQDVNLALKLAELYAQLYIGEQLERVIAALKPSAELIPGASDREPTYADLASGHWKMT